MISNVYKRLAKIVLPLCIVSGITGCTTVVENDQAALGSTVQPSYAISSISNYPVYFQQFSGYTLEAVTPKNVDENGILADRTYAYSLIADFLNKSLQAKGLKPATAVTQGRILTVKYAMATFQEVNDAELAKRLGISPGLVGSEMDKKVSLGMIFEAGGVDMWKGAAQGIPMDELSQEEKVTRLNTILAMLTEKVLN